MAKPLRSQLNQIRAWVRQGRTDAWIGHQLDVSTSELHEFRRRHGLSAEAEEGAEEADLRDEIEAEVAAATEEEADEEPDEEAGEEEPAEEAPERPAEPEAEEGATDEDGEPRRRRRRRRRRRGPKRAGAGLQASFDHGETDGYGLWLDPAIADDPVYAEHWAGHRQIEVTLEPERIVIKRTGSGSGGSDQS